MMRKRICASLVLLVLLTGCGYDSSLTNTDRAFLSDMKSSWFEGPREEDVLLKEIINSTPERVAAKRAQQGDFRILGVTGGYHAKVEDAKPMGITCDKDVEMIKTAFGCFPPPAVYFKMVVRYNIAMTSREDYPHHGHCSVPPEVEEGLKKMGDQEKKVVAEEKEEAYRRHAEKYKKLSGYN